ncbi:MAG: RNA-directed DNA polymerase [Methanomicrobia archaeon]|nr:RNA-directed DNA polymerase [Methanomicrobia archaeon]
MKVGLDKTIVDSLDPKMALKRIEKDIESDFIYAPHINDIYKYAGDNLWEELKGQLCAGKFNPSLPIYIDVPKKSGLTRPGAILLPLDRVLYQILIDYIAPKVESNLDRSKVFSRILLKSDEEGRMFEDIGESYTKFIENVVFNCSLYEYVVKTDVNSYFENIYHHPLIDSLKSSGISPKIVNILEKLLSAWQETSSYGIIQRCFPSDLLGTFYLSPIDHQLKINDIYSLRFVDDFYLFFDDKKEAHIALANLCKILRKDGLFLNEEKTSIKRSNLLIREETEIDHMMNQIDNNLKNTTIRETPYGFQIPLYGKFKLPEEEDFDIEIVEKLYSKRKSAKFQYDKIITFCLPLLARFKSKIAISDSIRDIINEPHLTRTYCGYLASLINDYKEISKKIISIALCGELLYEWQYMWIYATLLYRETVSEDIIDFALKQLQIKNTSEALRAICALLIGRFGTASHKNILRKEYQNDDSEYVRAAILYSASFFPSGQRNSCFRAWGHHSPINTLVISAIKNKRKVLLSKKR